MSAWPLTAFEEYMLCDDRPGYPMTGVFRMRLSGIPDKKAFQFALNTVVSRHCLLRCTVAFRAGKRPVWVDTPGWQPPVFWNPCCNSSGLPEMAFLDLSRVPGVRIWVIERQHSSDIIIQAHHACTDAIGICRVLEELLLLYAHHRSKKTSAPKLCEIDPNRFLLRGSPGNPPEINPARIDHLRGTWQFFTRRPVPLTPQRPIMNEKMAAEAVPAVRTIFLDKITTRKYFQSAKNLGVTINELLLRDCFLTAGAFRKEHRAGSEKDWIRFAIPINLRTRPEERLTMANCVSMVFSEQRMADLHDPEGLLKQIHDDIVIKSRSMLKSTFIDAVDLVRRVPNLLSFVTRTIPCFSTGVFSNMGFVMNSIPLPRKNGEILAGDVAVQCIEAFPPVRPGTQIALCAITYNNRLSVMLNADPRYFSNEHIKRFLEKIKRQIEMSIINVEQSNDPSH